MDRQLNSGQEDMGQAGELMPREFTLHWFPRLDSTNSFALEEPGLPQGTVIAADRQEAGRGRLGRAWQSPPGLNLYFSLVIYPGLARQHWGGFSLAAGLGLARGLAQIGLLPAVKWPNDLLVDGAKLAGILLESKDGRLVIGTGVNVNQERFPPGLRATSVRLGTGKIWRRDSLLPLLCRELYRACTDWDQGEFQLVLPAWREFDTILGKRVTVIRGKDIIAGTAVDVGTGGALIVIDDDGVRHTLHSGEVTLAKK